MDILSFVNSKDIRDYMHEIDYKCDSMQVAWLALFKAEELVVELYVG